MRLKCFLIILSIIINCFYCKDNDCKKCFPNSTVSEKDINRLKPFCGKILKHEDIDLHDNNLYRYDVGICTNFSTKHPLAGAIQTDQEKRVYAIGRLNNSELTVAGNVMLLEYHDGDSYGSHCNHENRNTLIVFYCDPEEDNGKFLFVDENRNKTKDCQYIFTYAHKDVCVEEVYSLSVGAIVLLIIFPVIFSYLLFGFLYKKFIRNAMGWELLPNFKFWKEFGALQADGCNFICRCGNTYNDAEYGERLLT